MHECCRTFFHLSFPSIMFFLCGHKGLIAWLSPQKWNQFSSDKAVGPTLVQNQPIKAKCLVGEREWWGGGFCERHPHCSGVSNIHFISHAGLVCVAGKMNSSVLPVGGGSSRITENEALKSIREGGCGWSAGRKHHPHTRRRLSIKNKILKVRFSFEMTPLLRSLEIFSLTKKGVNVNASLCYCDRPFTVFAKYPLTN